MAVADQVLLDAADVRDLIAAVRGLTMAIRDEGSRQRVRLESLNKQDVVTQMLAQLQRIADGQDRLFAALTARLGNGHDHQGDTNAENAR